MSDDERDPRWEMLDSARRRLLARFSVDGVTEVHWVAAFPHLPEAWAWLATTTDAQRDALRSEPSLAIDVHAILAEVGFGTDDVGRSRVDVESQETVDRSFEGSWFYRLR